MNGCFSQAVADDWISFLVDGKEFYRYYFLADGIYPDWAVFVKSDGDDGKFSMWQEAARKDIERVFGVLQQRFGFLAAPCRLWYLQEMHAVVKTCMIIHNMLIVVIAGGWGNKIFP
jgi:hypothetical protein